MYGALFLVAVSTSPLAPGQYREKWYTGGGIPRQHPYNAYFENRLNTPPGGAGTLTYSSPQVAPSGAGPAPASLVVHLPADARLTIDGDPTRFTGPTRRVAVRAGQEADVTMAFPAQAVAGK